MTQRPASHPSAGARPALPSTAAGTAAGAGKRGTAGRTASIQGRVLRGAERLVRREQLLREGELVLVGVSGGQDSLCLLDVLARVRSVFGLRLHVANVDHGLRGEEGAQEARYVAQLAAGYGLSFTGFSLDVAGYRRRHRLSTQAAARYARYQALARLAQELGAASLAVGHTQDDLVETMLMNLLRGTGLRGLAGIAPCQDLKADLLGPPVEGGWEAGTPGSLRVIRPLLEVGREDTAAYCAAVGLQPRTDPSNVQPAYLRSRVRSELLPLLGRYNPAVRRGLARTAAVLRGELELAERAVLAAWERTARAEAGRVEFQRHLFAREPAVLRPHLLRMAVARLRGTSEGLSSSTVEAAVRVATQAGPARRFNLPGGLEVRTGYDSFEVRLRSAATGDAPAEGAAPLLPAELPLPGEVDLGLVGKLRGELLEGPEALGTAQAEAGRAPRWVAWLDADSLGGPLKVRSRGPGDRMWPLGLGHEKKLQDILVDAKVPRELRPWVPVVEAPRGIAWLVGLRLDGRFALGQDTRRIAVLQFEPGPALAALRVPRGSR